MLEVGWRSIVYAQIQSEMHYVGRRTRYISVISCFLCARASAFRHYSEQCLERYLYKDAKETNLSSLRCGQVEKVVVDGSTQTVLLRHYFRLDVRTLTLPPKGSLFTSLRLTESVMVDSGSKVFSVIGSARCLPSVLVSDSQSSLNETA